MFFGNRETFYRLNKALNYRRLQIFCHLRICKSHGFIQEC